MLKKLFNRKRSDTPVIDRNIIPQHVAIIMDGNGRWAKRRGMPRSMGHRAGADVLKEIVMAADEIGIRALTVYGFSTENWKRPEQEVSLLMSLIKEYLNNIIAEKNVLINIVEVKNAETNAQLMAENIAAQLEKRISFRRAMKQTIQRAMKAGTLGVKTACSGRLGGAEIARTEQYNEGTIPLQTIRADIDYGFAEADTTYGKIGVKVWVYNGEVLPTKKVEKKEEANA